MITLEISHDELLMLIHAMMSSQFPKDSEVAAYRLFLKLKDLHK